jgi:hypothetical protein
MSSRLRSSDARKSKKLGQLPPLGRFQFFDPTGVRVPNNCPFFPEYVGRPPVERIWMALIVFDLIPEMIK